VGGASPASPASGVLSLRIPFPPMVTVRVVVLVAHLVGAAVEWWMVPHGGYGFWKMKKRKLMRTIY
jgi:hypothetical protein